MGIRTATRRAYRRSLLRGRRNLWATLAEPSGAIDVASVIVGVIIFAILGTITAAALVSAVPWSQEQEAKATLNNVRVAENAARIATGRYQTVPNLIAGGYLTKSKYSATTDPSSGVLPNAGVPLTTTGPGSFGTCYVAAVRLATGKVIWLSSSNTTIAKIDPANPAPDTACATFPPVATFPHAPLTLDYATTTFSSSQSNQSLPATVSPAGLAPTFKVTSGALPPQVTLDPDTGALIGPSAWGLTVKSVATGTYANCAVLSNGTGTCWGSNYLGQLANGANAANNSNVNSTPTQILASAGTPLTGITKIALGSGGALALGYTGCAVTTDTRVYCWGYNAYKQLGDNTVTNRNYAQTVKSSGATDFTGAVDVTVGGSHVCVITTTATAYCWGLGTSGQLGNSALSSQGNPVKVTGLAGATSISARGLDTCAVANGAAYCWGDNTNYVIGDATTSGTRSSPTQVSGLSTGVRRVAVGHQDACAVLTSGSVQCWGKGNGGLQLSATSGTTSTIPMTMTPPGTDAVDVTVGGVDANEVICALSSSGKATCWGYNSSGGLFGDGAGPPGGAYVAHTPTGFGSGANMISAGADSVCVIASGALKCWGANSNGQVGNGTGGSGLNQTTPVTVGSYTGISGLPATVTVTAKPNDGTTSASKTVTLSVN